MRYGIFSDIHSNVEALEAVITAYKREKIDRYLCVGDIVGYAACPKECIDIVKEIVMITVAGNHDWAAVNLFSIDYFNPAARNAILWTMRNLDDSSRYFLESLKLVYKNEDLVLVHGTLDNPGDFNYMTDRYASQQTFKLLDTNVCFIGHTHMPGVFIQERDRGIYYCQEDSIRLKEENKYIINVGSVGQPRDGNLDSAYCVFDTETRQVQIKRISYDIAKAQRKIIEKDLPLFLAQRLSLGR